MSAKRKSNPRKKAKKSRPSRAKRTLRRVEKVPTPPGAAAVGGEKLTFNHAMVYAADVGRALDFYCDLLGFKLVDEFRHEGIPVYARLRAPGGDGTIALHLAGPGTPLASDGVRLYFEIREVDDFCRKLQAKGLIQLNSSGLTWTCATVSDGMRHLPPRFLAPGILSSLSRVLMYWLVQPSSFAVLATSGIELQ
jgi:catechol 2,3-dioxygenase-like lactoylglutathione lyase family enzyme